MQKRDSLSRRTTAGVVEAPGSIVRVRSKADPQPALKGYARQVDEIRRQYGPG